MRLGGKPIHATEWYAKATDSACRIRLPQDSLSKLKVTGRNSIRIPPHSVAKSRLRGLALGQISGRHVNNPGTVNANGVPETTCESDEGNQTKVYPLREKLIKRKIERTMKLKIILCLVLVLSRG